MNQAYNPITNKYLEVIPIQSDIEPTTGFTIALKKGEELISAALSTKRDLKSVLGMVTKDTIQIGYSDLPISMISRKHLKQLLLHIDISQGSSSHRYNKIRSNLMMIYNELIERVVTYFRGMHNEY